MLIIGAGGLVLQMIDDLQEQFSDGIYCWASIQVQSNVIKKNVTIISTEEDVRNYFVYKSSKFILGIGQPILREKLANHFVKLGGELVSFIAKTAHISKYSEVKQSVVLRGAMIEAGAIVGNGSLINVNAIITHECKLDNYVEVGPGAVISGGVEIGEKTFIGAGAVVKPKVKIGSNVIVGAGAVVIHDVPDNVTVVGVPAKPLMK